MPIPDWSALAAYLVTMIGSFVVAKRSSNWRIRLLALTVGFVPLCQSIVLLARNRLWITDDIGKAAEILELLVSALCLTAVHLLNQENRDRKNTDARLRVAEVTPVREGHASEDDAY